LEREARYLRLLEEQRVQGIVITPATRSIRHLEALRDRGTFVVLLDRRSRAGQFCSVSVDHTHGGELAARHLFDLGHRLIAFINGPLHLSQCVERRKGMWRAATRAGLDPEECIVEYTIDPITAFEQAESTVEAIVATPERPTAIVCVNDQIAFAVLRALAERQVRVPRDISVVGYDDVDFAAMLSPALTSIRQPKYELGRAAGQLLIAETADPLHRHDEIRFEPELVERQSTTARARLNRYSPRGA
jgi:LacI family transcriptional regulator